jgi:three-Cys-motif partner protein
MAHKYGGPWSEVKLDAVEYYLQCYANALSRAKMDLWYIDAYAGSGDREHTREIGGLLEGTPLSTVTETLDGSARRALKIEPPFQHFIFIEKDKERSAQLLKVREEYSDRDIRILSGDANAELLRLVNEEPWVRRSRSKSRGVVFLDPFAMQVDRSTLQALARTESLDVWYFFNISAVTRQLSLDINGVGNKAPMLDRVLSRRWRELYSVPEAPTTIQGDIFEQFTVSTVKEISAKRTVSKAQIDVWFREILQQEFAYVSEPLPIVTPHSGHTFSLFLGVANPEPKATELAEKFVKYVNRKYAPKPQAFRRKSGR